MGRVTLAVLVAFIISFSILSTSLFLIHYKVEDGKLVLQASASMLNQQNFYAQVSKLNQKKIFLIGSSQVEPLNTDYIQDDLHRNGLNFTVDNLGIGGDVPKSRVKTIDWIISAKPTIVVYGISDRDLPIYDSPVFSIQTNLIHLPDIGQDWLPEELQKIQDKFYFLHSPKLDFLSFVYGNKSAQFRPFYPNPNVYAKYIESRKWPVANDTELEVESQQSHLSGIFPLEKNVDFNALKTMITKLHSNKIEVILYLTPQERHRLEKIPYPAQLIFALKNLTQEYPYVPVYSLWDRYADMHIWKDYTHIVENSGKPSRIYSDDIAKMILEEFPSDTKNRQVLTNDTGNPPKFNYELEPYQKALQ